MKKCRIPIAEAIVSMAVLLMSCNKGSDPAVRVPDISFPVQTIDATFYMPGSSPAPTIDWGGETGTLSLGNSIDGLSIDASSGVISWTKRLPEGEHSVEVIAKNSAGQSAASINLKNILAGKFIGVLNDNTNPYDLELTFSKDGNVSVKLGSDTATGTWSRKNGEILVNFTISGYGAKFSLLGALTQTDTEARYEGDWYYGHDALDANLGVGGFLATMN